MTLAHGLSDVLSTFQYIQPLVHDPVAVLADLILDLIVKQTMEPIFDDQEVRVWNGYLTNLHKEGYDCAEYRLEGISILEISRWDRQSLYKLILLLVEAGANIFRDTYIPILIEVVEGVIEMSSAPKDVLYILVQAGADVHALGDEGWSPSMMMRYSDNWTFWCEALQDSGKHVEEVLREEKNEWLLADDWRDIFFERTGRHPDDLGSESYYESDSDFETSDENQLDASNSEDESEFVCVFL
jgi:hypothetical protein